MRDDVLEATLSYNKYGGYCIPRRSVHRPAAQYVLSGRVWEEETIEYLVSVAKPNTDIVHAGTFFGDFLPALSRHFRVVYAFEPVEVNFRCAEVTCLLNGLYNVVLSKHALGATCGEALMKTKDEDGIYYGGHSHIAPDGDECVLVRKLDRALPAKTDISVIHLDVEYYEEYVLRGALATIIQHRPVLVVETLPEEFFEEKLVPLGYVLSHKVCGNHVLVPKSNA